MREIEDVYFAYKGLPEDSICDYSAHNLRCLLCLQYGIALHMNFFAVISYRGFSTGFTDKIIASTFRFHFVNVLI